MGPWGPGGPWGALGGPGGPWGALGEPWGALGGPWGALVGPWALGAYFPYPGLLRCGEHLRHTLPMPHGPMTPMAMTHAPHGTHGHGPMGSMGPMGMAQALGLGWARPKIQNSGRAPARPPAGAPGILDFLAQPRPHGPCPWVTWAMPMGVMGPWAWVRCAGGAPHSAAAQDRANRGKGGRGNFRFLCKFFLVSQLA